MSEIWTYGLSDFQLFSAQTYYRLFALYNQDIWPLQLPALAGGVAIAVLLFRKSGRQGRAISAILAASWLWVALIYHLQHYASINWAAPAFAAIFAGEAGLFVWIGVVRNRLVFKSVAPVLRRAALGIFLYALFLQPLLAPLSGRPWLQAELFGVAPDPTAIATLGVLLLAEPGPFRRLWIAPLLWCAISGAILWTVQSPQALVAPLAGTLALVFGLWR